MTEQRVRTVNIAAMQKLEGQFARSLAPILNSMYRAAASQVDHGNLRNADIVVDKNNERMQKLFEARYLRTAGIFGKIGVELYQDLKKGIDVKKQLSPTFWNAITLWAKNMAALRIRQIGTTTKQLIAAVVLRGIREGKGTAMISKDLRVAGALTSAVRANTVARTETHTAAAEATKVMVKELGATEKKWLHANDERVRDTHLEVDSDWIKMDDMFIVGDDEMEAPGIGGSAGNVINCRCVAMYR